MKKGVSPLISFILYTTLAILAVGIVLTVGYPYIEKVRDSVAVKSSQDFLNSLDNTITQVALAGENSKVPINLRFERGSYGFSKSENKISYALESDSSIISPGASKNIGSITLHADQTYLYVSLIYNKTNLILNGFNSSLYPGFHDLVVENKGIVNGNLTIEVRGN